MAILKGWEARKKAEHKQILKTNQTMKKLFPSIVIVRKVTSPIPASEFSRPSLEAAARTSLELGGFIQPPVVRRTGDELNFTYEVVSGHFQYHAACIAREIDPEAGEGMTCFILEEKTKTAITEQITLLAEAIDPEAEAIWTGIILEDDAPAPAPAPAPTPAPAPAPAPAPKNLEDNRSMAQLKQEAKKRGIVPTGDKRLKATWAKALAA